MSVTAGCPAARRAKLPSTGPSGQRRSPHHSATPVTASAASAASGEPIVLRAATPADVPIILRCIRGLAEYERLAHECGATEALLHETLFGERKGAEVTLAFAADGAPAGVALWFQSYSTFLARP